VEAVTGALRAAAEVSEAGGRPPSEATVDARHVACAFASERHLRGGPEDVGAPFAPLSRFAPTADGWIRLHANYAHHARALLAALGTDEARAPAAIAERGAEELEEAIVAAGGAAAPVRTPEAWAAHPQGRIAAALPLVERLPAAARPPRWRNASATPGRPLAGLRVLDLTRVIAGPVGTRVLAALGADVLRVDPPHLPELELAVLDTCPGKRLVALDLRRSADRATFDFLLEAADVLVHGYRPGALAAHGLDDDEVAARYPQVVVASLSAWGRAGPWGGRRGFDSLVQAACGIAAIEGTDGVPGALPVQALDHATGYLLAAAVLRELAARLRGEDASTLRLALAATAAELMRRPRAPGEEAEAVGCDRYRVTLGGLSLITPPGSVDGRPLAWSGPPRAGAPRWAARP
jgi:crotonobetainyl-CoA:carnitine CoA-transferase CaiB-like acyl-CoA transferase